MPDVTPSNESLPTRNSGSKRDVPLPGSCDMIEFEKSAAGGRGSHQPLARARRRWLSGAMTNTRSTGRPAGTVSARRNIRTERLAVALKANLRRRKVQARERAAETEEPSRDTDPGGSHDSARVVVDKRSG